VFTSDPQYGGSFEHALEDATNNNATLVVDSPSSLKKNASVAVPLIFAGGSIKLSGQTLTIPELTAAPLNQQLFDLTDTPATNLVINALRTPISLEMFGGGPSAADTANLLAFSAVAAVAQSNGGATVLLGEGTYSISDAPNFTDIPGLYIQGAGIDLTILQRSSGGTANPVLWFQSSSVVVQNGGISGCTIDGNGVAAECLRQTSCKQMTYNNMNLINATAIAWHWNAVGALMMGNNESCLVTNILIDQSELADYPFANGILLDGAIYPERGSTFLCTFIQMKITVNMGDAFTFGYCGNNAVIKCATFANGGRGFVFENSNRGNAHNTLLSAQPNTAGVYSMSGGKNFVLLDTANGAAEYPPIVYPGSQLIYLNEISVSNLGYIGLISSDTLGTAVSTYDGQSNLINWRQTATVNASGTVYNTNTIAVPLPSINNMAVGMYVVDTDNPSYVPTGTYITSVNLALETITLNQNCSGPSGGSTDRLEFTAVSVVNTTGTLTPTSMTVPVASTIGIIPGMLVLDLSTLAIF
jgi:hypothetical protein